MNRAELEALRLLLEAGERNKSIVDKGADLVVDVVEAPFKIVGRLFDDLFS
jgi:hypothetical protein